MSGEVALAGDSATAEYKDMARETRILAPGQITPYVFRVSQQPAFVRAFGLEDEDVIRIMMIAGPTGAELTEPFRPVVPASGDPPMDVELTAGRNYLVLYMPGRYTVERVEGAEGATVFATNSTVTHEAGTYYNEVTGDTAVNSIAAVSQSDALTFEADTPTGDVTLSVDLVLSDDANQILEVNGDGLFAEALQTAVASDTTSINTTVSVLGNQLTVGSAAIISPDANNILTAQANGLRALPVISAVAGNLLALVADGLYARTPYEEIVLQSSTAMDVIDADVDTVTFSGVVRGATPLMTYPTQNINWAPVVAGGTWGEIEAQVEIAGSSTAAPPNTYLVLTITDGEGDPIAIFRLENPGGDMVGGGSTYTFRWSGNLPSILAGTNPGGQAIFTCLGDATFDDVLLRYLRIRVYRP